MKARINICTWLLVSSVLLFSVGCRRAVVDRVHAEFVSSEVTVPANGDGKVAIRLQSVRESVEVKLTVCQTLSHFVKLTAYSGGALVKFENVAPFELEGCSEKIITIGKGREVVWPIEFEVETNESGDVNVSFGDFGTLGLGKDRVIYLHARVAIAGHRPFDEYEVLSAGQVVLRFGKLER